MTEDDFDAPLGLRRNASPSSRRTVAWRIAAAALGCIAAGLVAVAFTTDHQTSGEPFAKAPIETMASAPVRHAVAAPIRVARSVDMNPTAAISKPADDVEMEHGVKVVRPAGTGAPGMRIIKVPERSDLHLAAAADRRLIENSRYGPLPRIGADGAKPLEVYARPVVVDARLPAGAPRIALFVGGMGLSRTATRTALRELPGGVTLGFAPYGADLDGQVARARSLGHEIVLQLPMEGFDETPAEMHPHSLATTLDAAQNIDNLHWLMSRFVGYAGVSNFLGAKFTSDKTAFAPVLHDVGARGLYYLDDGTSPRSLAAALAAVEGTPVLQTDLVVDAVDQPAAIETALDKLVEIARARGRAIGVAAGLPATVDAIGGFARGLEARGIALVPLSAMIGPSASAVAGAQ